MRAGVAALLVLASLAAESQAAQPLTRSEETLINFGFATQLGSGVYSLSGRTLQVYNLPFEWNLPQREDTRVQWRLLLPFTIGFLDFKPVDVIDNGLPEHLDSFAFVPGVAADIRLGGGWTLEPYAQAGIARDRTSEATERVYALGLRSHYDFDGGVTHWQQSNELVHVVVDQDETESRDDFTRLRVGFTARRPFKEAATGQRADVLGYAFIELYADAPAGPAAQDDDHASPPQYELGFTLGATAGLHLWKIPVPRVGFGYRFGDGLQVYRLVLGAPF